MMSMTELFYGPIEPTWFVHQQSPGNKRPNGNYNNGNPYATPYTIYNDDSYTCRRNPYMQRNAVPYTMVAQDGAAYRLPGEGVMVYPFQQSAAAPHQYIAPSMAPISAANPVAENPKQSPARPGVLQPRNAINVQTLHLMVPLCCDKCEDKVKEQLLDLDDVERVTCDQWSQRVTITSSVAPEKLLKRVQKIKKRSTFWPQKQGGGGGGGAHAQVVNGVNGNVQAQLQQAQKRNQVLPNNENSFQQQA